MTPHERLTSGFRDFNNAIKVADDTLNTANVRLNKMKMALDYFYYGSEQKGTAIRVGSIGRQTDIHASDVDIIYKVPRSIYTRYSSYISNGPRAMLYAFRDVIYGEYTTTNVKADGLVVVVAFTDGIIFEIMPAVENSDGSFTYPSSNGEGTWRKTDPIPEIHAMNEVHGVTNRNAKKLSRMVRAWKETNGVSMGGLLIDTYVYRFLQNYSYKDYGYFYYDWLVRDFFQYLSNQNDEAAYIYALGSNQLI
ncbi:MAG: nucleotidyltransferase, partial [Hymenobacter sp.]